MSTSGMKPQSNIVEGGNLSGVRGTGESSSWRRNDSQSQSPGGKPKSAENAKGASSTSSRGNQKYKSKQSEPRPRPTHFLALPLNNHPELLEKVRNFQSSLLKHKNAIRGLDNKIIIDPPRLHFTLGVMALQPESEEVSTSAHTMGSDHTSTPIPTSLTSPNPKTVATALDLLESLRPEISEALEGRTGLQVALDHMNVLNEKVKEDGVDAEVLYFGPNLTGVEGGRLRKVSNLVHNAFKKAGYITERRPLKLHCTILNTSHRSPRGLPFSYTDIRAAPACKLIASTEENPDIKQESNKPESGISTQKAPRKESSTSTNEVPVPPPLKVSLGTYEVGSIELWVMGSHGENNQYVSVGGISLKPTAQIPR